jgi:hypothetical protein
VPEDARRLTPHAAATRPLARALFVVGLAACLIAAIPAPTADARSGDGPPTGEYIPHRVWQMKFNCVWAAGEMLLDKWTHGRVRIRQSVLRRASHDKKGGSSLYDLARGIARLTGRRLSFSPGHGDSMTWWQLLDRIDRGGGAVLIGEYRRLPAHYTRWDRSFARRRDSSHAVYIQSYDRARGRVWLMDPLADGAFPGEWISVGALYRFATFDHGRVMAAATPARHRATTPPLIDQAYRLTAPRLSGHPVAGSTVTVQVGLSIKWGFPRPKPQRLVATWVPIGTPQPTKPPGPLPVMIDSLSAAGEERPQGPVEVTTLSAPDRAGSNGFRAAVPVPVIPGRYRLSIGLTEVGRSRTVRRFRPIDLEVIPPFAASLSLSPMPAPTVRAVVPLQVTITNIGTIDWRAPTRSTHDPHRLVPPAQTVLVVTWRSPVGEVVPAAKVPVELAPGQTARLKLGLVAPPDAGPWTLAVDVINLDLGALSSTGRPLPTQPVNVSRERASA